MGTTCTECGRPSARLRRDRCNACYMRLYRNGELERGASCAVCRERRRPVLARVPFEGAPEGEEQRLVLCGNCALVLFRARPRPQSLAELSARVSRERRAGAASLDDRPGRRLTDRLNLPTPIDPSID